jgi:hypothetical protein
MTSVAIMVFSVFSKTCCLRLHDDLGTGNGGGHLKIRAHGVVNEYGLFGGDGEVLY